MECGLRVDGTDGWQRVWGGGRLKSRQPLRSRLAATGGVKCRTSLYQQCAAKLYQKSWLNVPGHKAQLLGLQTTRC